MIAKFELLALHTEVSDVTKKYAAKKLATLDKNIPAHSRGSARLEIRLRENKVRGKLRAICMATLHLPRRTISLTEKSYSLTGAVDTVRSRLKILIQKYKNEFTNHKRRRQLAARFRRSVSFEPTMPANAVA